MQHPKFVIRSREGAFHFHLTASNGEIILASQRYTTLRGAEDGVRSVQTNATVVERYERRRSRIEEPYFVLKAANGEVIGTSEMYATTPAMEHGIAAVQRAVPLAQVETWGEQRELG